MITTIYGDLFQSPAKVLVNPVNTVGVMGRGIAADFKRYYPAMFAEYQALCRAGRLDTGRLWLYRTPHKWVLNFPTKKHWRASSQLDYVEAGLQKLVASFAEWGLTSISFPRLASGAGGLDWETQVRPLIEAYLAPLPVAVYLHVYDPVMESRSPRALAAWLEGVPQPVTRERFWRDLTRLVKRQAMFQTVEEGQPGQPFQAALDIRRRSRNLILSSANGSPQYLSESILNEVWTYIQQAGYALPRNFPSGADAYAPYLVGLLSGLRYVRSVRMTFGGATQIGLHFIPLIERDPVRLMTPLMTTDTTGSERA